MFVQVYQFLGSIRLAVPLLVAIATLLIGTTIYESQVGSALVQATIYKSPWFGALMFLLAVNLSLSALSRYPWRGARKIGFALTHFGIVILIAGSAAVIHLGAEGLLVLRTDGPAQHDVRVAGDLLEVVGVDGQSQQVPLQVQADQSVSPATAAGLALVEFCDRVYPQTQFTDTGSVANPAVQIQLRSQRMGQTVQQWLAQFPQTYQQASLGPVSLELLSAPDDDQLQALLAKPANLNLGQSGQLTLQMGHQTQTLDVATHLGQTIPLAAEQHLTIRQFWPDFRLDDHSQPITASSNLQNPAVQIDIQTATGIERWYVFAQAGFDPIRAIVQGAPTVAPELTITYQAPPPTEHRFQVIVGPEQHLFYALYTDQDFQAGPLAIDQPIETGWADFEITLQTHLNNAQVDRQVLPAAPGQDGVPGLLLASPTGQKQWLQWGEPTEIPTDSGSIFAAFGPRSLALPFSIGLDDFIVERNEGTDSVAMWTSKIRIVDPHKGLIEHRHVWMNHPTWYQGWKIAQASWNPGDLSQSTLQVKREPIWVTALTWGGALMVVTGLGVMFYGPQWVRQWRQVDTPSPEVGGMTIPILEVLPIKLRTRAIPPTPPS